MKRILLSLVLTFAAANLMAQNPYLSLEGVVTLPDGSISLQQPSSSLTVDVVAECEQTICGPYARYAQKFLGVRAPLTDRLSWKVVSAEIALADENALYPGALVANSFEQVQYAESAEQFPLLQADKRSFLTPTLEEAARAAAEHIFSLRKHRLELVTGEAGENVFGEGLQAALNELARQEQAYLELFFGKQIRKRTSQRYTITPEAEKLQYVVCRLSPEQGLVPSTNLLGEMVVLQISPAEEVTTVIPEAGPKVVETAVCVVANRSVCSVSVAGEEIAQRVLPLYQYGRKIKIALPRQK